MNPSDHRRAGPGEPHNKTPDVIAYPRKGRYAVLKLAPQYPSGPEHAVCCDNDCVAHFFEQDLAKEYAKFKNRKPCPKSPPTPTA